MDVETHLGLTEKNISNFRIFPIYKLDQYQVLLSPRKTCLVLFLMRWFRTNCFNKISRETTLLQVLDCNYNFLSSFRDVFVLKTGRQMVRLSGTDLLQMIWNVLCQGETKTFRHKAGQKVGIHVFLSTANVYNEAGR